MYFGRQITEGVIPYRDLWDHKPPLIYYIDAIGVLLANHSLWGIWCIEVIATITAALASFISLRKIFPVAPAFLGTASWLTSLMLILKKGNLTTEYAIPLIFIIFWIFIDVYSGAKPWYKIFFIGVLGGLVFNLKQTTIGVLLTIILVISYQLVTKKNSWPKHTILLISTGFILVNLIIVAYFAMNNALYDYIDNVYIYNFHYIQASDHKFSIPLTLQLYGSVFAPSGLFITAVCGYVVAFINGAKTLLKRNEIEKVSADSILLLILIWFPIEVIFSSISGYGYIHYLQVSLPVMGLLVAYFIDFCLHPFQGKSSLLIFAILVISYLITYYYLWLSHREYSSQLSYNAKVRIIRSYTDKDDYVLLYGAESVVNFLTYTRSPSRFVYQYPLYMPGYSSESMINEFLSDIIEKKPILIIDTKNVSTPFFSFHITTNEINYKKAEIFRRYTECNNDGDWVYYCLEGK